MIDDGGPTHCGWGYSLAGGPGPYKKAGIVNYGEQASKQYPSIASAIAPASNSCPVWIPLVMNSDVVV